MSFHGFAADREITPGDSQRKINSKDYLFYLLISDTQQLLETKQLSV
jgi:hypothetical protein